MSTVPITKEALRDPRSADHTLGELRDYLRRGLARSFGRQLSDEDLEDLAQEATARVLTRLDTFHGRSKLTTWAMSIAVNEALQTLRRRRHEHIELSEAVERAHRLLTRPQAPWALEQAERVALLYKGIGSVLSEAQRDALLAELSGLPLAEIAARQGKSRGALYKSLHDARRKLQSYLIEHGIQPEDLGPSDDD